MAKQRISYFPVEQMDAEMQREMDRCRREGTPRPESSAVRARAGGVLGVRQFVARPFQERRVRPRHQGAVPALRFAFGASAIAAATSAR